MTESRDHFVYRALDVDGRVLYVGCTGHPGDRYKSHMRGDDGGQSGWFGPYVHRWAVAGPLPLSKALALEKQTIQELAPPFNSTVNPRGPLARRRLNGAALKAIRESMGLNATTVAAAVGVSRPFYSRLESGKRHGTIETAKRIADWLGVSLDAVTELALSRDRRRWKQQVAA